MVSTTKQIYSRIRKHLSNCTKTIIRLRRVLVQQKITDDVKMSRATFLCLPHSDVTSDLSERLSTVFTAYGKRRGALSYPFWQFLFALQRFQCKGGRFHVNENVSEKCFLLWCCKVLAIVCSEAKLLHFFFEVKQLPYMTTLHWLYQDITGKKKKKLKQHELRANSL